MPVRPHHIPPFVSSCITRCPSAEIPACLDITNTRYRCDGKSAGTIMWDPSPNAALFSALIIWKSKPFAAQPALIIRKSIVIDVEVTTRRQWSQSLFCRYLFYNAWSTRCISSGSILIPLAVFPFEESILRLLEVSARPNWLSLLPVRRCDRSQRPQSLSAHRRTF